jgi:hypothetical protein
MEVQLARLFGAASAEAKMKSRSPAQWKRTLRGVLLELFRYLEANVETDDVHWPMLHSGLAAAYESLKGSDFWPGYVEGITRLALILMGDYPDHRKRKEGRLSPKQVATLEKENCVTCTVPRGGALLMRPLLLHASSKCVVPKPRRVIHLEFAASELPLGLEWHDRV